MAKVITLQEARDLPLGQLRDWAYNALDTTGTREIADVLLPRLNEATARTYAFERALQAPALAMMLRGVRVDETLRNDMVKALRRELKKDLDGVGKMQQILEVWDGTEKETGFCPMEFGKHHKWPRGVADSPDRLCERCHAPRIKPKAFEPNSSDQVQHLFYDLLKVPPMLNKKHEVSADEDVLERIGAKYATLKPITDAILSVRDKAKQLGSLSARLTPDGRYPSSFNIGAAWTGRQSSSKNPYSLGGNLQNVAERHRAAFTSDPGYDIGYADYMQGESNIVAHLSGDPKYIEAHKGGDVHTFVTRYVWPNMQPPWTGDLKLDKKIAKQLPTWDNVPGHDFRFQCKRIQHGSNYGLTPFGISMIAHIPFPEAKAAQRNYYTEFEYIPAWQQWVGGEIREHKALVNPLGRTITLFGRPWDGHTWKQGLAFLPQSLLADMDNIAMWRVWMELESEGVHLLAQVHDALLFQFPRGRLDLARRVAAIMSFPVHVTDINGVTREMRIGSEVAVGRNWGHFNDDPTQGPINLYGIKELK